MKKLKQMAALGGLLMGSGVVVAQDTYHELEDPALAEANQSLQYQVPNKNAQDESDLKAFGDEYYYLFLAASGATETSTAQGYTYGGFGCMRATTGAKHLDVAVQVPDGHQINGFRYYWYDNDTNADTRAFLFKFNDTGSVISLGSTTTVISTDTSGYGSAFQQLEDSSGNFAPHTVDNSTGSYVIRFYSRETDNKIRMCGVRIAIFANPN